MGSTPDDFTRLSSSDSDPGSDTRVGAYRLVREIGEGGMGAVFLAVRDDDEFHKPSSSPRARARRGADAIRSGCGGASRATSTTS